MSQVFHHVPVMVEEVLSSFSDLGPGTVLDATVGGAGHAAALLEAHDDLRLLGIDRDEDAVAAARSVLARFGGRAVVVHACFDDLSEVLADHARFVDGRLAGALFDLGVSSHQLDTAARGFSLRATAPIDMRMDRSLTTTAADLVNTLSQGDLAALFLLNGEGRLSSRIARAIVARRPLTSTSELAEVVESAVPAAGRRRGHPASRVFQALRIAVNHELEMLGPALEVVIEALQPRARLVVLSYHSGEDRIVKDRFVRAETGGCTCPVGLPCVCGAVHLARRVGRGVRKPGLIERQANPRSSSARLRVLERLETAEQEKNPSGPGGA